VRESSFVLVCRLFPTHDACVFETGREGLAMPSTTEQFPREHVTAQISDAIVKLLAVHTGHGARSARTTLGDDVIICVLEDALTRGERSLLEHGERETVLSTRRAFQETMANEAVRVVEEISGRTVRAFMSANHVDPDLGAEVFVLEPVSENSHGPLASGARNHAPLEHLRRRRGD
jgi:uncharacterized protein YbcI